MNCRICNKQTNRIFNYLVLNKYQVDYYFCEACKFILTEDPYWLDESYKNPIASIDTGIIKRNLLFTKRASALLYFLFDKNKQFLDYGGGYGIFVRMMRDVGFDFYWEDKFTKNIISKGFDLSNNLENIELLSSFECFEHFLNPIEEISNLVKKSDNILFSTQLFQHQPPKPDGWWYYNFEAGQHISLYSKHSLEVIADKFNLNLSTDSKGFHLFSKKKINNTIFNMLIKFSQIGLFSIVKILMDSKTDSDMNKLKKILSTEIKK
jgi:hypothetical protein